VPNFETFFYIQFEVQQPAFFVARRIGPIYSKTPN